MLGFKNQPLTQASPLAAWRETPPTVSKLLGWRRCHSVLLVPCPNHYPACYLSSLSHPVVCPTSILPPGSSIVVCLSCVCPMCVFPFPIQSLTHHILLPTSFFPDHSGSYLPLPFHCPKRLLLTHIQHNLHLYSTFLITHKGQFPLSAFSISLCSASLHSAPLCHLMAQSSFMRADWLHFH